VSCGSTRRDRPGPACTTPIPPAAVAAPPWSRRSQPATLRGPFRQRPVMALDGPVARSARPKRGQLPGRPPRMTCRRTGPEPRKTRKGGPDAESASIPHSSPPGAHIAAAIRLLARQAERGTLRPVIPPEQRNAVPRGRPLNAAGGDGRILLRPCRKHQWMLKFLVALTLPDIPVKPGAACQAAADGLKRPAGPVSRAGDPSGAPHEPGPDHRGAARVRSNTQTTGL
jgi:hypothetical protein